LTFYGDAFTDDEISPFAAFDKSAIRAGIYIPQFPHFSNLDFRVEGVYTDPPSGGTVGRGFFYSNGTWRSGQTNEGNLLGDWIGRQSQGAQAWTTYWWSPQNSIQFTYRHQKVSQQFIPGGGTVNDAGAEVQLWARTNLSLATKVQYEKWNFPVLANTAQSNVTTSLEFTYWPGRKWNQ
jgi:hypothetical protein